MLGIFNTIVPIGTIVNGTEGTLAAISAGDYRAAGKTGIQTLLIAVATAITLGEGAAALAGGKGAGTAAIGQAENAALKSTSAAKPNGYSVAFETSIPKSGAGTRGAHFKSANERLTTEIGSNPVSAAAFEGLGIRVPTSGAGTVLGESPKGWTWHHVPDRPGVMQLVPTPQHQGGPWQPLFHPGGVGGFKLWGADF